MSRAILFVLFCAALIPSCRYIAPRRIPEEKFVQCYLDIAIMQDSLGRDTVSMRKILSAAKKKYNFTDEEYRNTIDYLSSDPQLWDKFCEKTQIALSKRKDKEL